MAEIMEPAIVTLTHNLRIDPIVGGTRTYFSEYTFSLVRPDGGARLADLVCPVCGSTASVRVASRVTIARRRRCALVVAVATAVVVAAVEVLFFGFGVGVAEFAGGVIPAGALIGITAASLSRSLQGVRTGPRFPFRSHGLSPLPQADAVQADRSNSRRLPPPPRFKLLTAFLPLMLIGVGFGVSFILDNDVGLGVLLMVLVAVGVPILMLLDWLLRRDH